ncbi:hypothetical protein EB835_12410 [Brevibacterium sp. S22]|nr:hypothetical protein EB835_12410 [Brevibacterium sp. S22]
MWGGHGGRTVRAPGRFEARSIQVSVGSRFGRFEVRSIRGPVCSSFGRFEFRTVLDARAV